VSAEDQSGKAAEDTVAKAVAEAQAQAAKEAQRTVTQVNAAVSSLKQLKNDLAAL